MSAQLHSPTLGTFEPEARLFDWLRAIDPAVRSTALCGISAGVALISVAPVAGVILVAVATAFIGWSKPDAVATHHERTAVEAALRDLDHRLQDGDLDADAYTVRRNWILETARA